MLGLIASLEEEKLLDDLIIWKRHVRNEIIQFILGA
jgi:hypothetical protein